MKNNLKDIGLIKFDIEGEEQEALNGAIKTITKEKPILMIPIYHRDDYLYKIPKFLHDLNMPFEFALKWTEKLILGVDCVLFVKFILCEIFPPYFVILLNLVTRKIINEKIIQSI